MRRALLPTVLLSALLAPATALGHVNYEDDYLGRDPDGGHVDPFHRDLHLHEDEPPRPPRRLTTAEVEGVLASAGVVACLDEIAGPHRATVRVRIGRDVVAHVTARVRPASDEAETCVRRTAEAALDWGGSVRVTSPIRASLAVRSDGLPIPYAFSVAEAVLGATDAIRACVGATGSLELTIRTRLDGALRFRRACLGSFVPDDDAERCLRTVVGALRIEPPATTSDATITVPL